MSLLGVFRFDWARHVEGRPRDQDFAKTAQVVPAVLRVEKTGQSFEEAAVVADPKAPSGTSTGDSIPR